MGILPNRQGSVATPGSVATQVSLASVSPQDPQHSPESVLTSQEFVTAEFYIDESMPSSYTESSGTAASGPRHHLPLVKTHHVITAELQQQLEDKNTAIIALQVRTIFVVLLDSTLEVRCDIALLTRLIVRA